MLSYLLIKGSRSCKVGDGGVDAPPKILKNHGELAVQIKTDESEKSAYPELMHKGKLWAAVNTQCPPSTSKAQALAGWNKYCIKFHGGRSAEPMTHHLRRIF